MINTVGFSYSNNRILITPGGTDPGLAEKLSGDFPSLFPADLKNSSLRHPTINLGNNGGTPNMIAPWSNAQDLYNVKDDFSWVRGSHTLKFGVFLGFNKKDELMVEAAQND